MILEFILTIDTETGYPKMYYPDGFLGHEDEKLSSPPARVTYHSVHSRYKDLQRVVNNGGQVFDSNPALPVPPREERAKWH